MVSHPRSPSSSRGVLPPLPTAPPPRHAGNDRNKRADKNRAEPEGANSSHLFGTGGSVRANHICQCRYIWQRYRAIRYRKYRRLPERHVLFPSKFTYGVWIPVFIAAATVAQPRRPYSEYSELHAGNSRWNNLDHCRSSKHGAGSTRSKQLHESGTAAPIRVLKNTT